MERLIAIGDIHGCFYTLQNLLDKVKYDSDTDTLVFVGDYIDRGYYSCEVVTFIRNLENLVGINKCICIRGNHEQMAIDAFEHGKQDLWYYNGGYNTIYSYDLNNRNMLDDIKWFKSLPLIYNTPKVLFCHAGLSKPLVKDNTAHDLIWGRDWIKNDNAAREKQVIFGHTPSKNNYAYVVPTGDICIDAACVFNGNLCALIIPEDGNSECVYVAKHPNDCAYTKDTQTEDAA